MSIPDFSSVVVDTSIASTGKYRLTPEMLQGPDWSVFAFDQSLASTGYVWLRRIQQKFYVRQVKTLRGGTHQRSGFEEDYLQAMQIERGVYSMLSDAAPLRDECTIAFETPAVSNRRTAAKLGPRVGVPGRMAGQAIYSAADRRGLMDSVRMDNSQHAKKLVCGNAKADKAEAHQALREADWIDGLDAALKNEHTRDALLIGLSALRLA